MSLSHDLADTGKVRVSRGCILKKPLKVYLAEFGPKKAESLLASSYHSRRPAAGPHVKRRFCKSCHVTVDDADCKIF